jgi:hypothetical protein
MFAARPFALNTATAALAGVAVRAIGRRHQNDYQGLNKLRFVTPSRLDEPGNQAPWLSEPGHSSF